MSPHQREVQKYKVLTLKKPCNALQFFLLAEDWDSKVMFQQTTVRTQTYFRLSLMAETTRQATAGNTSAFAGYVQCGVVVKVIYLKAGGTRFDRGQYICQTVIYVQWSLRGRLFAQLSAT